MHAALEVQASARPEHAARSHSDTPGVRGRRQGEAWLWLAGLLVVVGLSLADSIVSNTIAYERDTTVFYFPLMSWVGQQLQLGHFPLWTQQFFGGYPIFADGEIGLAYPPVLLALLILTPDRALVALRLLHLALAAVGMFAFARTWRLPYASAVLAGVVFTLGSFLQAQIHHENIVRTASWLPLVLACVEIALRAENRRTALRWSLLGAAALAMAGLSLHSQMLAMDLLVLATYAVFRWAIGPIGATVFFSSARASHCADGQSARRKRPWARRVAAVASVNVPVIVLGLGLAAVQILPLIELAGFSARGSGIPYAQSAAYSLTTFGLIQSVFPFFFRGQSNLQWGLWTHWESYLYIGLAPLVLAIVALACVRRREIAGWAIIGGLGLLLALGQYSPINLHYDLWLLPGLSGLRAPGRFTFVVVLAGAMLAAYGLAWLQQRDGSSTTVRRLLVGLSTALAALVVSVVGLHAAALAWPAAAAEFIRANYLALPHDSYSLPEPLVLSGFLWSTDLRNPHVLGGLAGLAIVVGALWLWQHSIWHAWRGWPGLFIALTAADLLLFGWAIHPREPVAKLASEPAAVQAVEQLPSPDAAPNRVLASPALNQVAPDRLAPFGSAQEANGYSSLQFIWHRDYLGRVLYADDALLDLWGVRYVLDPARFGVLAHYKQVSYLPQQALLHAPAGSALAEQRFALAAGTSVSELRFVTALQGAVQVPQDAPVAQVELRDSEDHVVGTADLLAGRDTMDWASDVPSVKPLLQHHPVESAGQTSEGSGPEPRTRTLSFAVFTFAHSVDARTLVVRAIPPSGEFVLLGGAVISLDGSIQQLFGKTKTKYQQVFADEQMRVFENIAAFPRAFVVPDATVAPSLGSALNAMVHLPFQPDRQVILADDSTTQSAGAPAARSGEGNARVTDYSSDSVTVHTSASGDAWLVLSDTYYPGWTATIDGQPAPVLRGDILFRVVPIPAGEHDVQFRFEPASVKVGLLISLASLLAVVVGLAVAGRPASPRRTT